MTRDEIKNTPELVDFMLDESVIADSRMKLHKRLEKLCKLAIKGLEQEPRKGHWISTETKGVRYAFWCRYKCSLCGGLSDYKNFCPNCGAKMESEEIRNDK